MTFARDTKINVYLFNNLRLCACCKLHFTDFSELDSVLLDHGMGKCSPCYLSNQKSIIEIYTK